MAPPARASPPARIRILLVDDHPMVRDGLRARLGSVPHFEIVGEAGSAEAALDAMAAGAPDVVITDVGMTGTSGIDLARTLRERHPDVRVLMFSMYDNPEHVQQALQAGARGYVLKDAPGNEIVAAIEAVVAGDTFLSPVLSRRLFRNQSQRPILSLRESEILSALGRGESSKQIARTFELSVRTVEAHRANIRRKLDLSGQAELIKYAVEHTRK